MAACFFVDENASSGYESRRTSKRTRQEQNEDVAIALDTVAHWVCQPSEPIMGQRENGSLC